MDNYAKPERNTEIRHLRESDPKTWTLQKLADRYDLSLSRIVKIIDPSKAKQQRPKPNLHARELDNSAGSDDFRRLLELANLSQFRLAKLFGLNGTTVNRWASGRAVFPIYARRYLELWIAYQRDTKLVRSIRITEDQE